MEITTFSVDLAKNKFQVHGFDARGEKRQARTLKRGQMLSFFEAQPVRCEVVMEACGGAHYWGRRLLDLGYRVRLIPPQFVKPFVVGNKTDANDADAIFEASRRTNVRPVPVKGIAQQDALLAHATREQWVKTRTALVNQIRGELAERGRVFGKGPAVLRREVRALLGEDLAGEISGIFRDWLIQRLADWQALDEHVAACDRTLQAQYRDTPICQHIGAVGGIGVMTATATSALVGNARHFRSGRHLAAWLGLTPKEHSSGERRHLGGLTKRGDAYLRKLFIHGGRAVAQATQRKHRLGRALNAQDRWILDLIARRGFNKTCVAVANKNARIIWAMMTRGTEYQPPQPVPAAA